MPHLGPAASQNIYGLHFLIKIFLYSIGQQVIPGVLFSGLSIGPFSKESEEIYLKKKKVHFLNLDYYKGIPGPKSFAFKITETSCQILWWGRTWLSGLF